jgi:hypothetical protein
MTLTIAPYVKPPTDKPVGMVLDADTVVGEWEGNRWRDIPKRAVLYVDDAPTMRPMYDAGEVEAIYWKKPGYMRSLSSWKWEHSDGHRHTIYDLRGTLKKAPDRLAALLAFVDRVRSLGGAPTSPPGMLHALTRLSQVSEFREQGARFPGTFLWRGSRIERGRHDKMTFGATDLWDIRSAFPHALRTAHVPRKWRHVVTDRIPEVESGFARARVDVPWFMHGPIPDVAKHHPDFPVETYLRGVWSLDELRAAEAVGCTVRVVEAWIGNSYRQPFADWGRLVDDLRASVPLSTVPLVKMAANRYVGRFAMDGHRERSRYVNGELVWIVEAGHKKPDSLTVHGLVTADVRARLYIDGIYPYPAHLVFCHTDGVALLTDASVDRRHPPLDRWRVKAFMERLVFLNPQRYAYQPGADDLGTDPWRYVCAGVPDEVAGDFFRRRFLKVRGRDADTRG